MDKQLSRLLKLLIILLCVVFILELYPILIKIVSTSIKFILPFVLGFTLAFLLCPVVDFFERRKFNRKIISLFVVIIFIGIFVLGVIWVVPNIIDEGRKFISNFPVYLENIKSFIINMGEMFGFEIDEKQMTLDKIFSFLNQNQISYIDYLSKFVQMTISYVVTIILTPILTLYFLIDYHKITEKVKKWMIDHNKEDKIDLVVELKNTMYSYFIGVFFVMLVMVVVSTICFTLIKLELSLLWGIVIGVTNIIPYIGPYIGGIIVGIFSIGSDPSKLVYIIIIIVVLQFVESNFLTPLVERKTVKTHPLLGIFFLSLFGEILGIFGMIIAVPCLSIIQIFINYKKYK